MAAPEGGQHFFHSVWADRGARGNDWAEARTFRKATAPRVEHGRTGFFLTAQHGRGGEYGLELVRCELIESCSCNMLCPCWYGVKELMVMDQGWCASPLLWRISQGSCDGVSLSGLTFALANFFPGPTLYDANGTARIYIDDTTTTEQRRVLESIMQGKKGGPMEVLAALITTWLPTQTTKIEIEEKNGTVSATVGRFGKIRSQRLKNEAGQQMTMQNVGFAALFGFKDQTAELAPGEGTRWSDPDMPRQWESKSGAVGTFTWNVT